MVVRSLTCRCLGSFGAMIAGLLAGPGDAAMAQAPSAYVITRPEPGVVSPTGPRDLTSTLRLDPGGVERVVLRPVVEPTATVARPLSLQPVRPWLVELRLATTTIFIDPHASLRQDFNRGIDENHTLMRAQRLGLNRSALPARVIRNEQAAAIEALDHGGAVPQPILRFRKPQPQRDAPQVAMRD